MILTGVFIRVLRGQVHNVVFHNLVLYEIGLPRILERRIFALVRMRVPVSFNVCCRSHEEDHHEG